MFGALEKAGISEAVAAKGVQSEEHLWEETARHNEGLLEYLRDDPFEARSRTGADIVMHWHIHVHVCRKSL